MYKELKLKANHNCAALTCVAQALLSNVQRAEVESKSQQYLVNAGETVSCYQMYKELKLKANHNKEQQHKIVSTVVIKCTKSWSWKQITTRPHIASFPCWLLSNVQRAEVESKSQQINSNLKRIIGCYQMYKELKLKANHNAPNLTIFSPYSCYQMYKELKLKANHNVAFFYLCHVGLLSNVQRAEVESKSQLSHSRWPCFTCCYQMYKELKLKANHNYVEVIVKPEVVVIKCTKSWSWKQITTMFHKDIFLL